jgi:hypothetical protein
MSQYNSIQIPSSQFATVYFSKYSKNLGGVKNPMFLRDFPYHRRTTGENFSRVHAQYGRKRERERGGRARHRERERERARIAENWEIIREKYSHICFLPGSNHIKLFTAVIHLGRLRLYLQTLD